MVPTTKKVPGAWLLDVNVTMPELSVAVGSVQVTVVPATPLPTVVVMSLIQLMTGGTVSSVGKCKEGKKNIKIIVILHT